MYKPRIMKTFSILFLYIYPVISFAQTSTWDFSEIVRSKDESKFARLLLAGAPKKEFVTPDDSSPSYSPASVALYEAIENGNHAFLDMILATDSIVVDERLHVRDQVLGMAGTGVYWTSGKGLGNSLNVFLSLVNEWAIDVHHPLLKDLDGVISDTIDSPVKQIALNQALKLAALTKARKEEPSERRIRYLTKMNGMLQQRLLLELQRK